MNVIEALVVTLGLDLRDFDKNDRRVNDALKKFTENAEKRTKSFESAGKKAAETFSSLKTEILGAVAAFAGFKGLQDFVQGTTDTQAALGRLAANTNTSASTLKAWGVVAEEVGAKAEDAYGAFDKINQQLAQASVTGTSPLLVMMRRLGITDVTNKSSIEDVLLKFSARLQQLPRNQAQYAANEAGLGGIFNELMLGPAELKKRLDQALGTLPATFNQSTLRAQQLQKQMALVRAEFDGLKNTIWNELEPAFFTLFQTIFDWMSKIDWNSVARWIANLIPSVEGLIGYVEDLNKASGGWLKTIGLIAAAWIAFNAVLSASPIGAVLLLAAAIVTLWNDYQTFEKGGKSLINWKAWEPDITAAINGLRTLGSVMDSLNQSIHDTHQAIGGFFARKAMHIKAGKTASDRYQQGSDEDRFYRYMATLYDVDPDTGKDLAPGGPGAPSGPSGGPSNPVSAGYLGPAGSDAVPTVTDALLDRVRATESGGNDSAVSGKGAEGPYQFLPGTGAQYGLTSKADLDDPVKSRRAAEMYINDLLVEFHGDLTKAMAAYNWGPGNVEKYGLSHLPTETQNYLARLGLPVTGGVGAGPGSAGVTQSMDKSSSSTQVGPIIVNVPPGADGQRIAADIQRSLARVNLPQALTTGTE